MGALNNLVGFAVSFVFGKGLDNFAGCRIALGVFNLLFGLGLIIVAAAVITDMRGVGDFFGDVFLWAFGLALLISSINYLRKREW